jgi:hypothetical protein
VDQISIDMNSAGNGIPAVGDRDGDLTADAEGAADPVNAFVMGECGNGRDDDIFDADGTTIAGDFPGEVDGVADDGCQVLLSTRETCREIFVDSLFSPGEDGIDRIIADVTIGQHDPLTGGGFFPYSELATFQVALNWSVDVVDGISADPHFLLHATGAGTPFTVVGPYGPSSLGVGLAASDASTYYESGWGVLVRFTLRGHAAGFADLTLVLSPGVSQPPVIYDNRNELVPIGAINGAQIAVAKDGEDAGTIVGDSIGELFTCGDHDADGIPNASDLCPTQPEDNGVNDGDGCPDTNVDSDGDGMTDDVDACPQDPGVFERMGCPVPAVGGVAGLISDGGPPPVTKPSRDESAKLKVVAVLACGVALLAGSSLALRARRGR